MADEKRSALEAISQATRDVYEFQHHPRLRGVSVAIEAVWLDFIVMEAPEVFGLFLPDEGEPLDPGRRNALRKRKKNLDEASVSMVRALIRIIEEGCPELQGHLHATRDKIPRDAAGNPNPLHFYYRQFGRDFMGLVWAILGLSGVTEDQAASARRFLGADARGAESACDGEDVRDDAGDAVAT